jgi:NAD+ kinase
MKLWCTARRVKQRTFALQSMAKFDLIVWLPTACWSPRQQAALHTTSLVCTRALARLCDPAERYAAHGPILPLSSNVLGLTAVCPFRPRRWAGAILPRNATVEFTVLDWDKRPVSAAADTKEFRDIASVTIREDPSNNFTLLFDPHHDLSERIYGEQFQSSL